MPGKLAEAVAWAKEVAEGMNKGFSPATPCQVLSERLGDHATVYWMLGIDSSADIDRAFAWSREDQEFGALLKRGDEAGLQVPGSRHEKLLLCR
jgi:hypothetical protein